MPSGPTGASHPIGVKGLAGSYMLRNMDNGTIRLLISRLVISQANPGVHTVAFPTGVVSLNRYVATEDEAEVQRILEAELERRGTSASPGTSAPYPGAPVRDMSYSQESVQDLQALNAEYEGLLLQGRIYKEVPGVGRSLHRIDLRRETTLIQTELERRSEQTSLPSSGTSVPWLLIGGVALAFYLFTRK